MVSPYPYVHLGLAQLAQAEGQPQPPSGVGAGNNPLLRGEDVWAETQGWPGEPSAGFWGPPLRSSSHQLMKSPEYSIRIIRESGKNNLQCSWVNEG